MAGIERSWQKRINSDPEILGDIPVVTGTRVPLEILIRDLANGATVDDISEAYRLTEPDIRAALMYATDLLVKARPKQPRRSRVRAAS